MIHTLAHAETDHNNQTDGFIHLIKTDGLKIILISVVAILIMLLVAKFTQDKSYKNNSKKEDNNDSK
ncbi:MAG: hypothetical protein WCJ60_02855 [bacterium]